MIFEPRAPQIDSHPRLFFGFSKELIAGRRFFQGREMNVGLRFWILKGPLSLRIMGVAAAAFQGIMVV